jgi:hypothetical protein
MIVVPWGEWIGVCQRYFWGDFGEILRKLQKVMKFSQKWKDFENNGTT